MNSMTIDGTDIGDYGLTLLRVPKVTKPQRRVRRIMIPGRSGSLTEWDGDYESYIKSPQFFFDGSGSAYDLSDTMDFLRSASLVTFDNEPDYAYSVRADEIIVPEMIQTDLYLITVNYETQPLKRLATELVYEDLMSYNLTNIGNEPAEPKLVVTGAGEQTVTVGTDTITITFAASGETITIDSLNGQIYDGDGNNAWSQVNGDLPVLPVSTTPVTISTTGSALTVYPNWRWS